MMNINQKAPSDDPFNVASDIRIHQSANMRSIPHQTAPRCTLVLNKWFEQCTWTLLPTRAIPRNEDLSLGISSSDTLIADHNCLILPNAILYSLTTKLLRTPIPQPQHTNDHWIMLERCMWNNIGKASDAFRCCLRFFHTIIPKNQSKHFRLHMQPLEMRNLTVINLNCKCWLFEMQ